MFVVVDFDSFRYLILSIIVMQVILPNQIEADERCKKSIVKINASPRLIMILYYLLSN
tara:strand:- start:630 stop:803 length:174 start_codon:yes stop_codon:yes gene_type:complete